MASRNIKYLTTDVVYKSLGSHPPPRDGRTVPEMDALTSLELAGTIIHESNLNTKDQATPVAVIHDTPNDQATPTFALGHTIDLIFAPFSKQFESISAGAGELTVPWDTLPQPEYIREEFPQPPNSLTAFQLYDTIEKRWRWPLLRTTSSTPLATTGTSPAPPAVNLSTEQQLALFFNTIAVAVDKKWMETSGGGAAESRILRHWMGDWSQKVLPGSEYCRKPDLVLVDKAITSMDKVTWLSPKVIGEYSREAYQPAGRLGKTMDTKAYIMLVEQPWRRFVLGLSVANDNLRLHFYDRSGGVVSPPFNIHLDPDRFIYVLCALTFGCRGCLGFDLSMEISPPLVEQRGKVSFLTRNVSIPSLHPPNDPDLVPSPSLVHSQPLLPNHFPGIGTMMIGDTLYELVDILFTSPSFLGRGTVCYLARHKGVSFVVKDQWVRKTPSRDLFNEIVMMNRLRHIDGVPKLHGYMIVQADEEADSTERYRATKWQKYMKAQRTHLRLVMAPHARPLTMFKSKQELVSCTRDIIRVLEQAAEEGILHRDCSLNNMAIEDLADGSSRGLLLDWEFGVDVNDMNQYSLGGTGTVPFMSASLLFQVEQITSSNLKRSLEMPIHKSASTTYQYVDDNSTVTHTHADDIESMFYVFIWIMIQYDGPLGHKRPFKNGEKTILDRWAAGGVAGLGGAADSKVAFLFTSTREDDLKNQVSPYFEDLFDFVKDWRKEVVKNVFPETSVKFSDVIPIFDRYLATPPEEKPPEMALIFQDLISDHRNLFTISETPSEPPSPSSPDSLTSLEPTSDLEPSTSEKRLSENVRSLDNPPVPSKRFRHV